MVGQKKKVLTVELLCKEATLFSTAESKHREKSIYGVTDGKAVGTYLEHKFQQHLSELYECVIGSSAMGIDFPQLGVDIKVTSVKQPQSSSPFKSARQKVYGLGYNLIVFVYNKIDDPVTKTAQLQILHTVFIESSRTADFQCTSGLLKLLDNHANADDIVAFLQDRNLPLDEIGARKLAEEILSKRPELGYLTISNALQWRLQYGRVIEVAGTVTGVVRLI